MVTFQSYMGDKKCLRQALSHGVDDALNRGRRPQTPVHPEKQHLVLQAAFPKVVQRCELRVFVVKLNHRVIRYGQRYL
jgi:hypothetical protein